VAIGRDLLNVPMGDMIRQMAFAIADAQYELDESSLRVAELMSGEVREVAEDGTFTPPRDTRVYFGRDADGDPARLSLIELGCTPTFYQFVDTLIEVKIAIKLTRETATERRTSGTQRTLSVSRGRISVTTTPVDATYSSKYSYSAEGSSLLRTKLVPIPPPAILEERIRNLLEEDTE
jgi:hypothetical protein